MACIFIISTSSAPLYFFLVSLFHICFLHNFLCPSFILLCSCPFFLFLSLETLQFQFVLSVSWHGDWTMTILPGFTSWKQALFCHDKLSTTSVRDFNTGASWSMLKCWQDWSCAGLIQTTTATVSLWKQQC